MANVTRREGAEQGWIDPRFLDATLSWPAVIVCSLSALALARAMQLPAVRAERGLSGSTATWVAATYPVTYVRQGAGRG